MKGGGSKKRGRKKIKCGEVRGAAGGIKRKTKADCKMREGSEGEVDYLSCLYLYSHQVYRRECYQ